MTYPSTVDAGTGVIVNVTPEGHILPTDKSAPIAAILETLSGVRRETNLCALCHSEIVNYNDFRDDLSRVEFAISRMCQSCQDETFTGGDSG